MKAHNLLMFVNIKLNRKAAHTSMDTKVAHFIIN